jgi:anti-sigma-K factor RskA
LRAKVETAFVPGSRAIDGTKKARDGKKRIGVELLPQTGVSSSERLMARFDSNDPRDERLWRLLGEAPRIEASPYFARKVLRAIEEPEAALGGSRLWQFLVRSLAPVAVCAGLAAMAIVAIQKESASATVASSDADFDTIRNLDLLVSNYESSLWLDSSSPSR